MRPRRVSRGCSPNRGSATTANESTRSVPAKRGFRGQLLTRAGRGERRHSPHSSTSVPASNGAAARGRRTRISPSQPGKTAPRTRAISVRTGSAGGTDRSVSCSGAPFAASTPCTTTGVPSGSHVRQSPRTASRAFAPSATPVHASDTSTAASAGWKAPGRAARRASTSAAIAARNPPRTQGSGAVEKRSAGKRPARRARSPRTSGRPSEFSGRCPTSRYSLYGAV